MSQWDTAANIINDAAVELGLYSADLTDPYDSTDANVVQLCRLLKSLGQKLAREHGWTHLEKSYTFPLVASTVAYDLPADFGRLIDGTYWNRTRQTPLVGPLSPQQWELLKAQSSSGTVDLMFRTFGNQVQFHPTPSSTDTIAYEYRSKWWVDAGGGDTPDAEEPMDGASTLHLDRDLLVAGLKSRFQRAKGFDSSASDAEFADALDRARGADGAAPTLSLSGRGSGALRLLDGANVPETGYGS